jgi:Recombinase
VIFHPLERTRNGNDPRAETRSAPESVGLSADENLPPIPGSSQGGLFKGRMTRTCRGKGIGTFTIVRRLNDERFPTFTSKGGWQNSTVNKIFSSAAAIGTFQPNRMEGGKRTLDGDPISNYFPRIVTQPVFEAAQRSRLELDYAKRPELNRQSQLTTSAQK